MWKAPIGSADLSVQRQSGRKQTQVPGKGRLCIFSRSTSFDNLYLSSSIKMWRECLALNGMIVRDLIGRLPGHSLLLTCWRPARRKMWVNCARISFDSVFLASGSALEVLHRSVFPMPNQLHLYCPPGKGNTADILCPHYPKYFLTPSDLSSHTKCSKSSFQHFSKSIRKHLFELWSRTERKAGFWRKLTSHKWVSLIHWFLLHYQQS